MNIYDTLKELRIEANLTQSELAKKLDIGQSTIVGYEKDNREPTLTNIIKYADFFEMSLDELVGRNPDEIHAGKSKALIKNNPPIDLTDKTILNLIKLYNAMNTLQKAQIFGYALGMLEAAGVNARAILAN